MELTIDTADSVLHGPTGETWPVAYVDGDRLAWLGWPEGEANLADCTLTKKATPEQRDKMLLQMAEMSRDRRGRYARQRLGLNDCPCPTNRIQGHHHGHPSPPPVAPSAPHDFTEDQGITVEGIQGPGSHWSGTYVVASVKQDTPTP